MGRGLGGGPPPPPPPPKGPGDFPKPAKTEPKLTPNWKPQESVWRGEFFREPKDVKVAGGFDSHAKRIFDGNHEKYSLKETPGKGLFTTEMFVDGSSLSEHGTWKRDYSQYVSFSTDMERAKIFATKPGKTGYVYKIRSSPNMIDVNESLGGKGFYKNAHESEVAAAYHAPWEHVEGWHRLERQGDGELQLGEFVANSDFNPDRITGTYSAQLGLAGWKDRTIYESQLYRPYKDIPAELELNQFLFNNVANKNVQAYRNMRPEQLPEDWRRLPIKTPNEPAEDATGGVERPEVCKRDVDCTALEKTQPENKGSEGKVEKTPPEKTYGPLSEKQLIEWADRYCARDDDNTMANFTQAKSELVKQGGSYAITLDLSTDGCSVPDIGTFAIGAAHKDNPTDRAELSFLPACERHDFCYRNFKKQNRFNHLSRAIIDEHFRNE